MSRLSRLLPVAYARCLEPGLTRIARVRALARALANLKQLLLRLVLATAGCAAPLGPSPDVDTGDQMARVGEATQQLETPPRALRPEA